MGAAGIAGGSASGGRGAAGGGAGLCGEAGNGGAAAGQNGGNGGAAAGQNGGNGGAAAGQNGGNGGIGGSVGGRAGSAGDAGGAAGNGGAAGSAGNTGGGAAGALGMAGSAGTNGTNDGGRSASDGAVDSDASKAMDGGTEVPPDGSGDGGDAGSGPDVSACWIGDFDGDGMPDCAIAGPGPTDVSFFKGVGGGAYAGTPVVTPSILPAGFVLLTAPLDMTAEGRDDLVFEALANKVDLVLLTGEAGGTFGRSTAQVPAYTFPEAPIGIPGHFDSTGNNELFVPIVQPYGLAGEAAGVVSWGVFYADAANDSQLTVTQAGFSATGPNAQSGYIIPSGAVGDVNGDQNLDGIAIVYFPTSGMGAGPPDQSVVIALGNGDRTFTGNIFVPGTNGATSVQANDVNQDGNLDLLIGLPAGPTTFYGDGTGHFSTTAP